MTAALAAAAMFAAVLSAQGAPAGQSRPARCRVDGQVTSAGTPLPGVSIVVRAGDALRTATSTDLDGRFTILFAPNATYQLTADLTGFAPGARAVVLGAPPCDQTVDLRLSLAPRAGAVLPPAAEAPPSSPRAGATPEPSAAAAARAAGRGGPSAPRFQTLNVQADANGATSLDVSPAQAAEEVSALLPPGFSLQAQGEAIAISGSNDATSLDRGLMNDRARMVNLAELDPATGQFAEGFGPQAFGRGGPGGFQGGPGGPGGFGGPGGPGGLGGRGGGRAFLLGGRGANGQRAYQGSATYTFGGSVLDSPPYQLNPAVPSTQPVFAQNTVGATLGGPLKIPGVYADTNRRTTFQVNYTGNRSNNVFDEYATVPTDAEAGRRLLREPWPARRSGDGAAGSTATRFPRAASAPARRRCCSSSRPPNLPGTTRNYHVSTTAYSSSEAVSLRLIQNLSQDRAAGPQRSRRSGWPLRRLRRRTRRAVRRLRRRRHEYRPHRPAAVSAQRPRAAERLSRSRQQHHEHEPDGADQPHRAPRPLDPELQRQRRARLDPDRQSVREHGERRLAGRHSVPVGRLRQSRSTGACRT